MINRFLSKKFKDYSDNDLIIVKSFVDMPFVDQLLKVIRSTDGLNDLSIDSFKSLFPSSSREKIKDGVVKCPHCEMISMLSEVAPHLFKEKQ